jgi:hypothetical protein
MSKRKEFDDATPLVSQPKVKAKGLLDCFFCFKTCRKHQRQNVLECHECKIMYHNWCRGSWATTCPHCLTETVGPFRDREGSLNGVEVPVKVEGEHSSKPSTDAEGIETTATTTTAATAATTATATASTTTSTTATTTATATGTTAEGVAPANSGTMHFCGAPLIYSLSLPIFCKENVDGGDVFARGGRVAQSNSVAGCS